MNQCFLQSTDQECKCIIGICSTRFWLVSKAQINVLDEILLDPLILFSPIIPLLLLNNIKANFL